MLHLELLTEFHDKPSAIEIARALLEAKEVLAEQYAVYCMALLNVQNMLPVSG